MCKFTKYPSTPRILMCTNLIFSIKNVIWENYFDCVLEFMNATTVSTYTHTVLICVLNM